MGLQGAVAHIEAPAKFTQEALNDSHQNLSLLSPKMSPMRKAVLPNKRTWNITTASQGGISPFSKQNESPDVSSLWIHMKLQTLWTPA